MIPLGKGDEITKMMKPYDALEQTWVDVYGYDINKTEKLLWSCSVEESSDYDEIIKRAKGLGFSYFEKRIITEVAELYEIE